MKWVVLAVVVLVSGGTVFVLSLPRLHHDGVHADDEALVAMIQGKPVFEVATWKILWRSDYAPDKPN